MKKHCLVFVLLFTLCLPLWGQLNIVGVNTEKPETTLNYFDKPIILDDIFPQYNVFDSNRDAFQYCIPKGERFYTAGIKHGVFIREGDSIVEGLPAGYYRYVGIILYREQLDSVFSGTKHYKRIKGIDNGVVDYSTLYTEEDCSRYLRYGILQTKQEVKQQLYLKKTYPSWFYPWSIIEGDDGRRYYVSDHTDRKQFLMLDYVDSLTAMFKGKKVAFDKRKEKYETNEYEARDYWTGNSVLLSGFYLPAFHANSSYTLNYRKTKDISQFKIEGGQSSIKYYLCKDLLIDIKRAGEWEEENKIVLLASLDDMNGSSFTIRLPNQNGLEYSGVLGPGDGFCIDYRGHLYSEEAISSLTKQAELFAKEKERLEMIAKQKEAKAEQVRRNKIIQQYGEKMGNLILNQKLALGMTPEMCKASIGYPSQSYRTTTALGTVMVYQYAFMVLTFSNDKLISVTEAD